LASLAQRISLNEVANNLGVIKTRRSLFADALPHFERAFQGDPSDPDFCFNLGVCLGSLHNYPEAAKVLEQCLRLNEEDVEAHAMLALVLAQLGDAAGHQREVQWLTDREGNSAENLNGDLLPQTRLKKKYDGRAARLLELAVRNALEERLAGEPAERHGDVHLARGKKLLAQGLWPEAEQELTEAASLLPRDSEAHLALAQVYAAQGRNRAAAELEVSLKLKNTAITHLWLARVYLSLDQPEVADRHGRASLNLDPNNHEAQALMNQISKPAPAEGKKP
jgi:tetratricopeptide (TPR) repeat protein